MVPRAGIEPAWPHSRGILSPLRLPISPPRHLTLVSEPLYSNYKNKPDPSRIICKLFYGLVVSGVQFNH